MTVDVIEGARYRDHVFDDDFVVVAVESEENVPDDEEIDVTIEYDMLDTQMVVSLEQLKADQNIDVVEVPGE